MQLDQAIRLAERAKGYKYKGQYEQALIALADSYKVVIADSNGRRFGNGQSPQLGADSATLGGAGCGDV